MMITKVIKWLALGLAVGALLAACNLSASRTEQEARVVITPQGGQPNAPSVPSPAPPSPFPPMVADNLRRIYAYGRDLGNRPDVFSKVGDSITVSTAFLAPIGEGLYQLGDFGHLQEVIAHYAAGFARTGNPFVNRSLAADVGWAAWAALDPSFSDSAHCLAGEMPLVCEYRHTRPSVALIFYGTNDAGYRTTEQFRADIERILDISEQMGVIPILSTVPYRPNLEARIAAYNGALLELTTTRGLPLWDYATVMKSLPSGGLGSDGVHPSAPPLVYDSAADFRAGNLRYGVVVRNLTALQMLDAVWRTVR